MVNFFGYLVFVLLYSLAVNENAAGEDFQRHNIAVKSVIAQQEWAYDLSPVMRKDLYDVDSIPDIWTWTMGPFLSAVLAGSQQSYPDMNPGDFYRTFRLLGQVCNAQAVSSIYFDIPQHKYSIYCDIPQHKYVYEILTRCMKF